MIVARKKLDMLTDHPGRSLLQFALPIILGNLVQQFYSMADSIIVGQFVGEGGFTAVSSSYAITNVFISVAIGAGLGHSVIVSQYLGAKQNGNMKTAISTSLFNFLLFGVVLSVIGVVFCKEILVFLNTPADIMKDAKTYLDVYFVGLPFLFLYNVESTVFNALGDSKTPLKLLLFSSVLNVVLDLLFVGPLGMGVAGAAIATLIAQGVSAIISFVILIRVVKRNYGEEKFKYYSPQVCGKMLRIAIPSMLQQLIVTGGMLLVQSVVNGFGSVALAGYSAGMRFESICCVPMLALGNAASTYTAQNMGANKISRVKRGYHASYKIIIVIAIGMCLILQLFAKNFLSAFLDPVASKEAFTMALGYVKFLSFFYVLVGMKMVTDGVLRGAGNVWAFTTANLVNLAIRMILAYTLAPVIGVQAVWYAVPLGWLANYVISFGYYLTGKWYKKSVI